MREHTNGEWKAKGGINVKGNKGKILNKIQIREY